MSSKSEKSDIVDLSTISWCENADKSSHNQKWETRVSGYNNISTLK
jgi:hypothetical protein